ncbi:MAG: hypothetical protein ACOYD6_04270 [Limnochordia bacterium]
MNRQCPQCSYQVTCEQLRCPRCGHQFEMGCSGCTGCSLFSLWGRRPKSPKEQSPSPNAS